MRPSSLPPLERSSLPPRHQRNSVLVLATIVAICAASALIAVYLRPRTRVVPVGLRCEVQKNDDGSTSVRVWDRP